MNALKVALIVVFAIISVILILLVVVQNDEGGGLGGLLSGSGTAAFGSHSSSVLNKATFVLVGLFFVVAFLIARFNKASVVKDVNSPAAIEQVENAPQNGEGFDDWYKEDAPAPAEQVESEMTAPEAVEQ